MSVVNNSPRPSAGAPGAGWRTGMSLLLALFVTGCAQLQESPPTKGQSKNDASAPSQEKAADPIARFATSAPQGASSQVSYNGGGVWVTVGPYYQSADGSRCRRVTMRADEGGSHVSAVCRDNGRWQTVLTY